jgi:hypothetical protein
MTNPETFAERVWPAISPEGKESVAYIRVSTPKLQPRGEWTVTVSLTPMTHRSDDIHGTDSWQAVELAMLHAAKLVQHFERIGWRFYWDDIDREAACAADLLRSRDI